MTRIQPQGIDHVVLRVVSMERMVAFYCDALGCALERGTVDGDFVQLRAGNALVDFVRIPEASVGRSVGSRPNPQRNMHHVCLRVHPWNAESLAAHLTRHHAHPGAVALRQGAYGLGPSLYVDDPEGNTVELKAAPSANPERKPTHDS